MYQAGTFKAVIKDYGIGETKAGDPQVFLVLDVQFENDIKGMTWYGNFNGGAKVHTIKALLACGFEGNDPGVLLDGPDSGAIKIGAEVSVVVEEVDKQDASGNVTGKIHKVLWVNRIGGVGNIKRADPGTMKAKMAKLNLAGDVAKFRAGNPGLSNPAVNEEDVPFA